MNNEKTQNTTTTTSISILIPSLKRDHKTIACISSILASSIKGVEVFLLDQNQKTSLLFKQFVACHPQVYYIKTNTTNKSKALNLALTQAKGHIIAYTDDDCIVSKQWIKEILSSFSIYKEVSIVTGNTCPYGTIPRWSCPPTIQTKTSLFSTPSHHKHIGYGNNFAIKKDVFTAIGVFKTWLGPGSISTNCEDGEILIRALTHKLKILHNQNMIVYHNKKLDHSELQKQQHSYILGEAACYMFYTLQGFEFAKRVMKQNVIDSLNEWKRLGKNILQHKPIRMKDFIIPIDNCIARCMGICIGTWKYVLEKHLLC